MNKFNYTAAIIFSFCAVGVSAQGFDTNCTRDYYGNVSCHTAPAHTNESSLNELRQIIGTPMPAVRGISPADTANLLHQYQMQQQQQQYLEQLRILRCQQAPAETMCFR